MSRKNYNYNIQSTCIWQNWRKYSIIYLVFGNINFIPSLHFIITKESFSYDYLVFKSIKETRGVKCYLTSGILP